MKRKGDIMGQSNR